jgi:hypothetical protein
MNNARSAILIGCAMVVALALGACRKEEQGRILSYSKGVYLGKADTERSDAARRDVRARTRLQGGLNRANRGGGIAIRAPDVRAPAAPGVSDKLRQRARHQSYN